ncbi:MAG: cation transporter [Pseudomonadales bacterium]|nr:cation transporter [Pseudomonadales bacterium]MCP5357280.1 cation transporter [Pseudomonadales bacterium]
MHSHSHHSHEHASAGASSRIAWAFFLNAGFSVIEFIGGMLTNSTAIMADAVHDLGDSLAIGLAWGLAKFSDSPSSDSFSYGYRRFSLLGALINGVILLLGSLWVLNHAIPRLQNPVMPETTGMLVLALFGVVVNGLAAYKLGQGSTQNERMLNWHLLEDVLGWVAVLIVSVVLMFADWPILDPILSIVFTLFILLNVLRQLWKTLRLFLQAAPEELEISEIRSALQNLDGIGDVHHVQLWSLDGEHHVLTAHVVVTDNADLAGLSQLKLHIADALKPYGLAYTTIEFELGGEICRDEMGSM